VSRIPARLRSGVAWAIALLSVAGIAGEKENAMFDHDFIETNGVRLHAVSKGAGTTMLFLHGFPEFWYLWRHQLEEFGADHRAVAVDMRGYNLSDKPPQVDAYSTKNLVADVKGLLDHLSAGEPAILVGHDWGGAVAWAFALAHPEYLEKLIIVNAPHPAVFLRELATSDEQRKASSYMHFFRRPDAEQRLALNEFQPMLNIVVASSARPEAYTDEDRAAYLESWARPGALTGGLNYYRAQPAGPPRDEAEGKATAAMLEQLLAERSYEVRVPTLVVWGMQDSALLPGNLDGLDSYVPDLRIHRIEDGSHWVINEQPEAVNAAIRAFLGEPATTDE
jgi:pimeloyl-ACP methyl ester carboxylesterase